MACAERTSVLVQAAALLILSILLFSLTGCGDPPIEDSDPTTAPPAPSGTETPAPTPTSSAESSTDEPDPSGPGATPAVSPTPSDATPPASPTPSDATPPASPTPSDATPPASPTPSDATPPASPTPSDVAPAPAPVEARSTELDAQFLIQSTFGPTQGNLDSIASESYTAWIQAQMELGASSHRAYYRAKASPRPSGSSFSGHTRSPCAAGSRWVQFAMNAADVGSAITIAGSQLSVAGVLRTEIDPAFTGNGLSAPDTCTNSLPDTNYYADKTCDGLELQWAQYCSGGTSEVFVEAESCQQGCFDANRGYGSYDCSPGWPHLGNFDGIICAAESAVRGYVLLAPGSDPCDGSTTVAMLNPAVWRADASNAADATGWGINSATLAGVVTLATTVSPCSLQSSSFIRASGAFYVHDARVALLRNTLSNPAVAAADDTKCPNVAKTFVNEDTCVLATTCAPLEFESSLFELSPESLGLFFTVHGAYVYAVKGLTTTASPCSVLSRWRQMDCASEACAATGGLSSSDLQAVEMALASQDGLLRDIYPSCLSVPANAVVATGGLYFQHVHKDEHSVYDFTAWVTMHPGGSSQITQWAVQPFELQFPSSHDMSRWEDNKASLTYIGRKGDVVDYADLPDSLQDQALYDALVPSGAEPLATYFEACGSPDEVANDPPQGHHMAFHVDYDNGALDQSFDSDQDTFKMAKGTTWIMLALNADDQLRQRMAWALAQLVVVGEVGLGQIFMHEMWVTFYDILVRNAFGCYRDLLREVTYSPAMGDYLTYRRNMAFDHSGNYPDENYAREIMQLFTIGRYMLNADGTRMQDAGGNDIMAYDNEDIMDFSRILTGFERQLERTNTENQKGNTNRIDPMKMVAKWHDAYPKTDLYDGHIGDGYPLCADVPVGAFLQAGAKYRFVGYAYTGRDALLLSTDSALYAALCQPAGGGSCQFQRIVEIAADLVCSGAECGSDTVRTLKVGNGYYEYDPPTCVYLAFYNGQEVTEGGNRYNNVNRKWCANPDTLVAGAACCAGCTDVPTGWMRKRGYTCEDAETEMPKMYTKKCVHSVGWHSYKPCQLSCWEHGVGYPGDDCSFGAYAEHRACSHMQETGRYSWAQAQCGAKGMVVCHQQTKLVGDACAYDSSDVWTQSTCTLSVAVHEGGKVSFWYDDDAKANQFRVQWADGQYPSASDGCPNVCTVEGKACVCPALVEVSQVYGAVPDASQFDLLYVGSLMPTTACFQCAGDVRAYYGPGSTSIDENTVFEKGGRFRKNKESRVVLGDYSFRNPPSFTATMLGATKKGALAEVEALLTHLFEHPNTPPFVAFRLIQRFTTSNPSSAYVRAVADAFRTGEYGATVYSGQYGDLGATVAAILLDPEARAPQARPEVGALREPVLKVMHFMRSMEFAEPLQRQLVMDFSEAIGQEAYKSPDVFNFYGPEYQPMGFPDGVYGPEFQLFSSPAAMGWVNGMMSIIDSGVASCNDGFGRSCAVGVNYGSLAAQPRGTSAEEIVATLDVLLTGGRLGPSTSIVLNSYSEAAEGDRLQAALRAILLTPEFHTMGNPQLAPDLGPVQQPTPEPVAQQLPQPYKAVVFLYFDGGLDSFNLIVPYQCALWDEYVAARGDVAMAQSELHPISTDGQACVQFGVHGALGIVKELYDAGEAAFVSNIGGLVEPVTNVTHMNGAASKCVGLYSHLDMKLGAQTLQCQVAGASPKGVGGRMADALASRDYKTASFSVAGTATFSSGFNTPINTLDKKHGAVRMNAYEALLPVINNISRQSSASVFVEEYLHQFSSALQESELLGFYLDDVTLQTESSYSTDSKIEQEFNQVARLIATRSARNAERDIFYVHLSGFDTHTDLKETLQKKFVELNAALEDFVAEMRAQGVWDQVTIMTSSDFGRTLSSNGHGTDHGWAGNQLVLGGDVQGGRVFNDYPSTLLPGSTYDAGRGRLIPQYPWESMVAPIASWMGVDASQDLATVLPNLGNFDAATHIIDAGAMFRR